MQYTYFECHLYHRLGYGEITTFKARFPNKIQLILGSNGSGKSSLIREITPLPSNSKSYQKGGYKKVHFTHRGIEYIACSLFDTSNRHSLLRIHDGVEEELNKGGTASVQKELCKQLFGITQEIHDLLTSSQQFTAFAPVKRREWLTQMSNINYEFAFGLYQKLKDMLRDQQGALKFTQSRLIQETANRINENDILSIKQEINVLNEVLQALIEERSSETIQYDVMDELSSLVATQNMINNNLKENLRKLNINPIHLGLEDAIVERISLTEHITFFNKTLNETEKRLIEMDQRIHQQKNNSLDAIEIELSKCKEELYHYPQRTIPFDISDTYPLKEKEQLLSAYSTLEGLMNNAPILEKEAKPKELFEIYSSKIQTAKIGLDRVNKLIDLAEAFLKHQESLASEEKTECPSCKHLFIPGFKPEKIEQVRTNLEKFYFQQKEEEKQLVQLEGEMKKIEEALFIIRQLKSLQTFSPFMESVVGWLLTNPNLFSHPIEIIRLVDDLLLDLKSEEQKNRIKKQMDDIEKQKHHLSKVNQSAIDQIVKERNLLEETYLKQIQEKNQIKEKIVTIKRYIDLLERIDEACKKATNLSNEIESKEKQRLNYLKQQAINEAIRYIQLEISPREHRLAIASKQETIINSLEKDVSDLQNKVEHTKLLVEGLSPTEGLIAKNVHGFIKTFVNQMNAFIKNTWTYPLEILPCGFSEENKELDLDYKFPLKVQGKSPEQDIALGSKSMQEVINLAFKVIAMNYLKITDSPLYLDEFGHSFDTEHRRLAYAMINTLLANSSLPQIFVISHFEDCYGSLKNADVIVIDGVNISLPKNTLFNQHVEIA